MVCYQKDIFGPEGFKSKTFLLSSFDAATLSRSNLDAPFPGLASQGFGLDFLGQNRFIVHSDGSLAFTCAQGRQHQVPLLETLCFNSAVSKDNEHLRTVLEVDLTDDFIFLESAHSISSPMRTLLIQLIKYHQCRSMDVGIIRPSKFRGPHQSNWHQNG